MHTRTCIQVCKFLEMISKDGVFCPLRPDLPLKWPGWPALSCAAPRPPLQTCLPNPFLSPTVCAPLFPSIPCLPPLTGLCCPSITVPCGFLTVQGRSQQRASFVCCPVSVVTSRVSCCSTKDGKANASANGLACEPLKLHLWNQVLAIPGLQAVVVSSPFRACQT